MVFVFTYGFLVFLVVMFLFRWSVFTTGVGGTGLFRTLSQLAGLLLLVFLLLLSVQTFLQWTVWS